MKKPLIVLAGPTAVGKTALSVRLAAAVGGEIVSADSMQVYRGMDVGTAKVTKAEMRGVPHHLIDILEPEEEFNVCIFSRLAREAIQKIHAAGRIPILTGGSGFYIQAALYDIDFPAASEDALLKERLQEELREKGEEAMYGRLALLDPAAAGRIHPRNIKRVLRALEFRLLTGKSMAEHNEAQQKKRSPYRFLYYVLTMDRQALYRRIELRVDRMIADGLVEEVKRLRERGLSSSHVSMQGIGYRQIFDYLEGAATLEEAIARIKLETRHFAKRQLTWFRREPEALWLDCGEIGRGKLLERMTEESLGLIEQEV